MASTRGRGGSGGGGPTRTSASLLPLGAGSGSGSGGRGLRCTRRAGLIGLTLLVFVFLWMQYTILTTSLLRVPAQLSQRLAARANATLPRAPGLHLSDLGHLRVRPNKDVRDATVPPPPEAAIAGVETPTATATERKPSAAAVAATPTTKRRPQKETATAAPKAAAAAAAIEAAAADAALDYTQPIPAAIQERRRLAVKEAMRFAWGNYEEHAFGGDEVDPKLGARRADVWGDIACSLVDGMDTLWVMDLKDEFWRARDYVARHLRFDHLGGKGSDISVFETIIREVGGLLSAFSLSGDAVFKDKARELMDLIVPAFHKDEGVFYTFLNPQTKSRHFAPWSQYRAHLADLGTLQLETRYLSDITGDPKYAEMGEAFYKILQREGSFEKTGLFPVHFYPNTGKFDTQSSLITVGALGDSFYEYLLKVYIYSGKRQEDAFLREFYDDAVRGMEEHLLFYSEPDDLYFLQDVRVPSMGAKQQMEHLVCFVPGLLALGTLHEKNDVEKNERHLKLAKRLAETCYQMYHRQASGLSPDIVRFPPMTSSDAKYRLRPETIESLFYLYRVTKDDKYRHYGWEIFQSIEKNAKVAHGYGAVEDVRKVPTDVEAKMESFFLAETLKYHYLLQAPVDILPLDEYVFNTEAHPIRIRQR